MISGEMLKNIREAHNLSQEELAQLLKYPTSYIADIEENKKQASAKFVGKLIEQLELSDEGIFIDDWESELTLLLGDQIRALRESKNLSLEALGALTGLSSSYISEIERKQTIPSLTTLRRIAKAFNVPVSLFIGNNRKWSLVTEKLVRARKTRGLSQKELASKAGVSAGLIGQMETGKVYPSLKTIEKIADALGVSVCSLILEQEEVEEVIGALSPELRSLLYQPRIQSLLGSICSMEEEKLKLVFNFIAMLNSNGL
ncbi:MAG: helix-turn-helix transcriptional regulator [Clostridia bacterium]|jgi:transcriptional regulator with XRE-family HTH domain|nr:helix-turn-helix transcriptional regulator [Clostridia bacterium]